MNDKQSLVKRLNVQDLVVNWHLTQACNYRCHYCYAAWTRPAEATAVWRDAKQSYQLLSGLSQFFASGNIQNPLASAMRWEGLRLSLAGGEPLLLGQRFRQIVNQAEQLGFKVSLITNGSHLDSDTLAWLCPRLEMLGISVDAADSVQNQLIGRQDRHGCTDTPNRLAQLIRIARRINPCLIIKLNTVVNSYNWDQDLQPLIERCQPDRWKVLRVLPSLSQDHAITSAQFKHFLDQHAALTRLMSVEDNQQMQGSYIMIDPHGRFFQNAPSSWNESGYRYSDRINDVGISEAFSQIEFSAYRFSARYQSQREWVAV